MNKPELFARCDQALDAIGVSAPRRSLWVPGRIEVLGKHTDYAGGRSLVCAVERGFCVRFAARKDGAVRVIDVARREQFDTRLDPSAAGRRGEWGNYVATVVRRFARDFAAARVGADIALESDLPSSAGLSSSSALVVAVSLVLIETSGLGQTREFLDLVPTREDLGGYLGAVENGASYRALAGDAGVGTFGGSEDHTAVLCSTANMLAQFSYAPVRREADVAMPPGYTFVIGASGVTASKTGAALGRYNRLSVATSRILSAWNAHAGRKDATLAAAVSSSRAAVEDIRAVAESSGSGEYTGDQLRERFDQFVAESFEIVPAATAALQSGDVSRFGDMTDRSHRLAETHLGNQIPETMHLQRSARTAGAVAASAFGAGFGGSVWAMVEEAGAADFIARWQKDYRAAYPQSAARAVFFVTKAAPSASLL